MNKKVKIPLIIIGCILLLLCLGLDGTYIYIKYFSGNKKIISNTFELGFQTLADGETKKTFLELNYFTNENKNGLELFEIKYNYLMDEKKEYFFSQGLQYYGIGNSCSSNSSIAIDLDNFTLDDDYDRGKKTGGWPNYRYYGDWFGRYTPYSVYNYQSIDDYETVSKSSNPIGKDSSFKIDLDGDIYIMQFKDYKLKSDANCMATDIMVNGAYKVLWNTFDYVDFYFYYDYSYFSKVLFNAIQGVTPGTSQYMVFEFGDLFDYYAFNEKTGQYSKVVKENNNLLDVITSKVNSYYTIKVTVSEDGAQRASDSMFNMVCGSQNWVHEKVSGDSSAEDYYVGRSVVELDIDDFEVVTIVKDNYTFVYLSLCSDTRNKWYDYRDKIILKGTIPKKYNNMTFSGFDESSLDGFNYDLVLSGGA